MEAAARGMVEVVVALLEAAGAGAAQLANTEDKKGNVSSFVCCACWFDAVWV